VLSARHLAATAGEVRRGRWGRRAAAQTLRPPVIDAVMSLSDPLPGIVQVGRMARRKAS